MKDKKNFNEILNAIINYGTEGAANIFNEKNTKDQITQNELKKKSVIFVVDKEGSIQILEKNKPKNETCPDCGGDGYVMCNVCGGTGFIFTKRQLGEKNSVFECDNCAGVGDLVCSTCGGSGVKKEIDDELEDGIKKVVESTLDDLIKRTPHKTLIGSVIFPDHKIQYTQNSIVIIPAVNQQTLLKDSTFENELICAEQFFELYDLKKHILISPEYFYNEPNH